jgi:hypothetical protein
MFLLAAIVLTTEATTKSAREVEKPEINKIAQLSATEHSTILFSVADDAFA